MGRRVLFVHDGPIYMDQEGNYYGIHYNDELIERYLKLGTEVIFLIRTKEIESSNSVGLQKIRKSNFSVFAFPNYKSIKLFILNYRKAKQVINRAIKDCDIIICRLPSASGYEAAKLALRQQKPLLIEYVACTYDAYWNYDWRGKLIAYYKKRQQQVLMRRVPYSIYVTKMFLQQRYPTEGTSVSCSDVQIEKLTEDQLNDRLSGIDKINAKSPIKLGTIGALNVTYKGQADVIKAIALLKKRGVVFSYSLVGQGDSKRLIRLAEKNEVADLVNIIGPLEHKEVFRFLKDIDVYIHPSRLEGLPRAILEAMSTACPVLGSKVGGIPELLEESMLFNPGDVNNIVEKLQSLNINILKNQAVRNFKEAHDYQRELLDKKRVEFYEKFLAEKII